MKRAILFLFHSVSGTVGTVFLAIVMRQAVLVPLARFAGIRTDIDIEVKDFVWIFIVIGLVTGYLNHARFGDGSAFLVLILPATATLWKLLTFPSVSVFRSRYSDGWENRGQTGRFLVAFAMPK